MHRPCYKERRLGRLCCSPPRRASTVPHTSPSHGRFCSSTLPFPPTSPLHGGISKRFSEKQTGCYFHSSSGGTGTGMGSWSSDDDESCRKLARSRRLKHPHQWIRTCHMPEQPSTNKTSRVRLIVSEEISSSYSHLFTSSQVLEPYDPETYQDDDYLTLRRERWGNPSLDRISELSRTSSSDKVPIRCKFSGCSSPARKVDKTTSVRKSIESSDAVELARAPACSQLMGSGDRETFNEERRDRLKEIQSHSEFIVALEKEKPATLYRNLEAIERKLLETQQAINGMCSASRGEGSAKNADAVIAFLQSTIGKSIETLRHLENLDAIVCQKIISDLASILSKLKGEELALKTTAKLTDSSKNYDSSSSDFGQSTESTHYESDAASTFGVCSPRSLPRRQTHRKCVGSRRRRCPHAHRFDRVRGGGGRSVVTCPSRFHTSAPDWCCCHETCRPQYQTYLPFDDPVASPRNERLERGPKQKQIPGNLARKWSYHVPPKRVRYIPQLPPERPRPVCTSCRRPHRQLFNPNQLLRDPFNPESDLPTYYSHVFHNAPPTEDGIGPDCSVGGNITQVPVHDYQSGLFFNFPETETLCTSPGERRTTWIPDYPVDNSKRRLPTYLVRRRLRRFMESQQTCRQPESSLQDVFSRDYVPCAAGQTQLSSTFSHYPGCYHCRNMPTSKCRYASSPDDSLSYASALPFARRERTGRSKVRKGRSNIIAVRSDDADSEGSDLKSVTSSRLKASSVREAYTVVVKCARINVYVDKEDEERPLIENRDDSSRSGIQHKKDSDIESTGTNRESEENSEKVKPLSACTSCQDGTGDRLLPANSCHGLYKSFTRIKVSPTKGDALAGLTKNHATRRHLKRVGSESGECDRFAERCDKSEKYRRLAKPDDASRTRTDSLSGSSMIETSSSSSSPSSWTSASATPYSSHEDIYQLSSYNSTVSAAVTSPPSPPPPPRPRPLRRWLVLGSEWTPPAEGAPVKAIFDTPSQTSPLLNIKGNDFSSGTMQGTKIKKEPVDSQTSNVAFPEDVTCSYTSSGHRIESCVASYVFGRPGSQGLAVPLEASVVPPDDEEIANLSFQRMGSIPGDGKSSPKPLVVFPQSVDSVLSPSGHHLESCCARFVFLNDGTTSTKSSASDFQEQAGSLSAPSRTFVILPFFRATPLFPAET